MTRTARMQRAGSSPATISAVHIGSSRLPQIEADAVLARPRREDLRHRRGRSFAHGPGDTGR